MFKTSGNLTISNESGGLFSTKGSGVLWVVGVRLCEIGKVHETGEEALKSGEEVKKERNKRK